MVSEVTWQSNPPELLLKERFHISTGFHPGQRDIYDSGYMLREVGLTLMQAGAKAVYPLTITRTAHSDDQ